MQFYLSFLLLFSCTFSYGQDDQEWVLFQDISGVEFYQKQTDCTPENIPDQTGVLIKIVNTNSYSIKAEWDLRIWYNGTEQTDNVKDDENHLTVIVPKKESLEGSCSVPNGELYIFKEFITFKGGVEMTNFQFDELTIEKVKR